MALHKLVLNDFEDTDYMLFAIHSELECYRIAQTINLHLKTRLKRTKKDLELKSHQKLSFPLFEWNNAALRSTWNLIQNHCSIEISAPGQGLFSENDDQSSTTYPLLEKHATVDYFLKISGEYPSDVNINKTLNQVPSIHMIYSIDVETLKSKDYLILN